MEKDNSYYIYMYINRDLKPYYIGKGSQYRAYVKHNNVHKPSDKSRIIILYDNLTEEEAFEKEKYLIELFGRKCNNTGILLNIHEGGTGGNFEHLGEERHEEIKRKRVESYKRAYHSKTEEEKEKIRKNISKSRKGKKNIKNSLFRKGKTPAKTPDGTVILVTKEEFRSNTQLVGLNKGRKFKQEVKT